MNSIPRATRGIVSFDLDGTLLRGDTVCEVIARQLGRLDEMKRFEHFTAESGIADGRARMVEWYRDHSVEELRAYLDNVSWAPGAQEGVRQLHEAGIVVGIASMTWKFAVRWFASRLGIRHFLGTGLDKQRVIVHIWGRDKARWLLDLAESHGISSNRIASVGDSAGDAEMLRVAGREPRA